MENNDRDINEQVLKTENRNRGHPGGNFCMERPARHPEKTQATKKEFQETGSV
jgi:hypothetical protein